MESWLPFFVIVASLAVVLQAIVLVAVYLQIRRLGQRAEQMALELQARANPILSRIQVLVEEAQPQISSMIADAAHITHLARTQVQHADRVVGEAIDRLRMQLLHTDQILTGALEAIEETGSNLRRTILGPVQSVSAVVHGFQTGLEFFRGNRARRRTDAPQAETPDESLFI
jgi:predicted PurR-regulated permease PerM